MSRRPTAADVKNSYHPRGFDESASLQRARKPYLMRNILTGGAIATFIAGVYFYSISAVKQDDFSDVADLLPPEAERAKTRSIEDEMRDKALTAGPADSAVVNPNVVMATDAKVVADVYASAASDLVKGAEHLKDKLEGKLDGASANTTPANATTAAPSAPSADKGSVLGALAPRRLSDLDWVRARGWVEPGRDNALVWGAPSVDNIGRMRDSGDSIGKRAV